MKRFIINLVLFGIWLVLWFLACYWVSSEFLKCNTFAITATTAIGMMGGFVTGLNLFGRW